MTEGPKTRSEQILGDILTNPELIKAVPDLILSDFQVKEERNLFEEILRQVEDGEGFDLLKLGQIAPGGHAYLNRIQTGLIPSKRPEVFARDVRNLKEQRHQRNLFYLFEREKKIVADSGRDVGFDTDQIRTEIEAIEALRDGGKKGIIDIRDFSLSSQAEGFKFFIETKRKSEFWGHKIGCFPILTRALMGLREIIVFAAKPKTGKSTFALQVASDLHDQGVGILYYDFENSRFNLMARELSRKHSLSFVDIYSESGDQVAYTEGGVRWFEDYKNFCIMTDRKLSIEKIHSHVKQMKNLTGRDDIFIVIDSLQKLPMENLRERRAAVDFWLRGFEELKAEDPGLSILLVSELSREGGKPKESGDIEYTGHFLLELQMNQTEEELPERGDDNIRKLYIKAARDVQLPAGPVRYQADFRYWKFTEIEGPE